MVAYPTEQDARNMSRKGVFFACASCAKMWEGLALGKETCTGVSCGGPSRRKDFPEYDGFIKDFSALCFVCGSEEVLAYAKVEDSEKMFGICKDHLELIDNQLTFSGTTEDAKKVLIVPDTSKALAEFRGARHIL